LSAGGSATYTVSATIASTATGSLSNTATITPPVGTTDPVPANNNATDTDTLTPVADLSITVTDGSPTAIPGSLVTYTIAVSNAGPSAANGTALVDTFPVVLTDVTWTCSFAGSGSSGAPSGSGNINQTINLSAGGGAIYTVSGMIASTATDTLSNTATVTPLAGTTDPNPANNSATDTDTLISAAILTVTINGNGSVNSQNAAGSNYACNGGTCQPVTFSIGDIVTLTATGANSSFTSWGGDISGSANPYTTLLMDDDKAVTATFTADPARVRIDGDATLYYALGSTLAIPTGPATVRAQSTPDFIENIIMANPVTILLKGGYSDNGFSNQSGYTTVSGYLKIRAGQLTVERLRIKP